MRIIDWSSDVCSSDLWPSAAERRRAIDAALEQGGPLDPFAPRGADAVGKWLSADQTKAHDQLIEIPLLSPDPDDLTLRTARLLGMADTVYHLSDIPVVILDRARADAVRLTAVRSEERRVGQECVRTCRSRWAP